MSQDLDAWIGKQHTTEDVVSLGRARALAATLDRGPDALAEGQPLPAGWHWIYFNELAPRSELAADGHAERGHFLPPVRHPHRMWAQGKLALPGRLLIGEKARRLSTIHAIEEKKGRSGQLVFVTITHEISSDSGVQIEETMKLVYLTRDPNAGGVPAPVDADPDSEFDWVIPFTADEVTLFRFSALTLNSHRIHFDQPYATQVEGYPGLVVHGPLLALLMLDAGATHLEPHEAPDTFNYRARRPLFCNEEFRLRGRRDVGMWIEATHPERGVASRGELVVRSTG